MRLSKKLPHALLAASLVSALALVGCGGSGTQQGGADDAAQTSGEITTAEEVPQVEETTLTNADVAGIYLLDSEVKNDALFIVYLFDEDGSFTIRLVAGDAAMDRKGTYEIRDGKIYVNVPKGDSFELMGNTYTASAIEDAEVLIEDDALTTDDIGSNQQNGRKITKDEYDQLAQKAAEAGPKKIAVGEAVSGDGYTFTVNSFEFKDEVYPSDTSGYYTYWQHEDDHDYLVADVTYVNDGTEYQVVGAATAALISIGENNYNATIETDGGSRTSSTYSIDPKDTGRVIVLASIPDAAREEGAEVKLTWAFPKDGSLMNYRFSNDNDNVRYILTK